MIYDQLKLGRLHYRQIARLFSLENPTDITGTRLPHNHMHRRDNRLGVTSITYEGLDEDMLALSGSPSQNFGSGDGLTLSCEIDGRLSKA
jgi:hypothetical protein